MGPITNHCFRDNPNSRGHLYASLAWTWVKTCVDVGKCMPGEDIHLWMILTSELLLLLLVVSTVGILEKTERGPPVGT